MITYKINNRDLKYNDILLSKDDGMGGRNISFSSSDFTRDFITVRTNYFHGVEEDDVITFTLEDSDGAKVLDIAKSCIESKPDEFTITSFSDYEIHPEYFTEIEDFNLPISYNEELPIEERRKGILFGSNEDYLHYFYRFKNYEVDEYISSTNGRVCMVTNAIYDEDTKMIKFINESVSVNDDGVEEKHETVIEEYMISKFIGNGTFTSLDFNSDELKITISYVNNKGENESVIVDVVNTIDEKKRCKGDIVMCDYNFLMKMNDVEDNRYDFSTFELLNTVHDIYIMDSDGEEFLLKDCIVPLMEYGENNKMSLIWSYNPLNDEDVEIAEYIKENFYSLVFKVRNDLFLEYVGDELKLRENANVYKTVGDIIVQIPFSETPDINLQQQDIFNDFLVDEIVNKHVNNIVDMEKQIFVPVLKIGDDKYSDVRKLIFNTKLKQRGDSPYNIETTMQAWKDNYVIDTWVKDDDMPKNDVLGYWGFTDEDVKYQKNALKKSFIRLSFYDTNRRSTQSLLCYCTLFMDSGRMYGKYMKNINGGVKPSIVHNTTLVNGEDLMINGSLFVVDNTDTTQSSEGFYLYLFPNLCKGTVPTTIYMKAEFNHAKFGATIPLVKTLRKNGKKKLGYIQPSGDIAKMKELFEDIYIPINIRYNSDKSRYEWIVGEGEENENGEFSFDFYEPIINAGDEVNLNDNI